MVFAAAVAPPAATPYTNESSVPYDASLYTESVTVYTGHSLTVKSVEAIAAPLRPAVEPIVSSVALVMPEITASP